MAEADNMLMVGLKDLTNCGTFSVMEETTQQVTVAGGQFFQHFPHSFSYHLQTRRTLIEIFGP